MNKEHYHGILREAKPKFTFFKGNLEPDILSNFFYQKNMVF